MRFQRSINVSNKTEQSIYECLLASALTTLRRHKFWLHRAVFFRPISRNEEMMGDGFFVLLLPVCFEQ